jgi:uncharacterized protein (TIGR02001 family)
MRKLLLASAVSAALSLPMTAFAQTAPAASPAAAPASPHTFTGNFGLFSEYRFRGISQTFKRPALQGGFDYSHANGIYLGTWASNVSSNTYPNGNLEWDFYGGYKFELGKGVGIDLGGIYYYYPGSHTLPPVQPVPGFGAVGAVPESTKINNGELYIGATYSYFSAKYNRSLTNLFGLNNAMVTGFSTPVGITGATPATSLCGFQSDGQISASNCYGSAPGDSKGSGYTDLNFNYPFGDKWTFGLHAGHQTVKNWRQHSYTDWKISLNKEWEGLNFGLAYIATNAKREWYRYTTPNFAAPPAVGSAGQEIKDASSGTLLLSVSKTF